LLYELEGSALADGTVIVIITGFSRTQIKYPSSAEGTALAKAVRNLIYSF
jgi:hypothetical protein